MPSKRMVNRQANRAHFTIVCHAEARTPTKLREDAKRFSMLNLKYNLASEAWKHLSEAAKYRLVKEKADHNGYIDKMKEMDSSQNIILIRRRDYRKSEIYTLGIASNLYSKKIPFQHHLVQYDCDFHVLASMLLINNYRECLSAIWIHSNPKKTYNDINFPFYDSEYQIEPHFIDQTYERKELPIYCNFPYDIQEYVPKMRNFEYFDEWRKELIQSPALQKYNEMNEYDSQSPFPIVLTQQVVSYMLKRLVYNVTRFDIDQDITRELKGAIARVHQAYPKFTLHSLVPYLTIRDRMKNTSYRMASLHDQFILGSLKNGIDFEECWEESFEEHEHLWNVFFSGDLPYTRPPCIVKKKDLQAFQILFAPNTGNFRMIADDFNQLQQHVPETGGTGQIRANKELVYCFFAGQEHKSGNDVVRNSNQLTLSCIVYFITKMAQTIENINSINGPKHPNEKTQRQTEASDERIGQYIDMHLILEWWHIEKMIAGTTFYKKVPKHMKEKETKSHRLMRVNCAFFAIMRMNMIKEHTGDHLRILTNAYEMLMIDSPAGMLSSIKEEVENYLGLIRIFINDLFMKIEYFVSYNRTSEPDDTTMNLLVTDPIQVIEPSIKWTNLVPTCYLKVLDRIRVYYCNECQHEKPDRDDDHDYFEIKEPPSGCKCIFMHRDVLDSFEWMNYTCCPTITPIEASETLLVYQSLVQCLKLFWVSTLAINFARFCNREDVEFTPEELQKPELFAIFN